MTAKKKTRKALGKGMGALIPEKKESPKKATQEGVRRVPLEEVSPMKGQPRSLFHDADIEELAASIKEKGILQPLLVREAKPEVFELIAGERRWRAAKIAGLMTVPVIVKDVDEAEAYVLALIENLQRENLNALDTAKAFQKMAKDFDLSHDDIAQAVGKQRASVTNYLRILKLPLAFQEAMKEGKIQFGHARALAALPERSLNKIDKKRLLAGQVSVRALERQVAKIRKEAEEPKASKQPSSEESQIRHIEQRLQSKLGMKIALKDKSGKGQLTIHYRSLDELEGVLRRLGYNG